MGANSVSDRRAFRDESARMDPSAAPAETVSFIPSKLADPGPLGLAAFALTTFVLELASTPASCPTRPSPWCSASPSPTAASPSSCRHVGVPHRQHLRRGRVLLLRRLLAVVLGVRPVLRQIPAADAGHAVGLYLIAWGIFTTYMFVASLRTTAAVAAVFFLLAITFFLLGIGDAGEHTASLSSAAASGWRPRSPRGTRRSPE